MTPRLSRGLTMLLALAVGAFALPGETQEKENDEDEKTLQASGLRTDTASLLEFFRNRTLSEAQRSGLAEAVKQLGSGSFAVREKASQTLACAGNAAVPLLKAAAKDSDPEVARRARECLEILESGVETERARAAARLLGRRRALDAASILLNYLPFADEAAESDLLAALRGAAMPDGRPDQVLGEALKDPNARRRAAAAWVVGQSENLEHRTAVHPLLSDRDPVVRWRAAQGLIAGQDKKAVPALIALLTEAPLPLAAQAAELLGEIAGEQAPQRALGSSEAQRQECRQAWTLWWRDHERHLVLAKLEPRRKPLLPAITPVPPNRRPDVVFVPTPHEVVRKMLDLAKVKKGDVVYDLGSGDGRIVITAAKEYAAHGFGFEIDPELVKQAEANVRLQKVDKLVTIKQADVFTLDLREANVITLYLLPSLNVKLIPQLEKCKPGTRIVSHDFDMKGVTPNQVVKVTPQGPGNREHTVYLWITPLKKE